MSDEPSTLLLCARVHPGREAPVRAVAGALAKRAARCAGAESVEFWPPAPPDQLESGGARSLRFRSMHLRQWRRGEVKSQAVEEVAPLVEGGIAMQLVGQAAVDYSVAHGVTMVIVTEIKPGKEAAYRAWADRIQKLQATFPGYLGSFVQPPQQGETGWTTVLRFDSAANLEGWLKSDARAAMVKDSEDLVAGFHAQRVDTSFPGLGAERSRHRQAAQHVEDGVPRAAHAVSPSSCWSFGSSIRTHVLNPAVGTFIGNAISVGLTTWPLMPLAICGLPRLAVSREQPRWVVWAMPLVLVLCYLLEIALLWHLLQPDERARGRSIRGPLNQSLSPRSFQAFRVMRLPP